MLEEFGEIQKEVMMIRLTLYTRHLIISLQYIRRFKAFDHAVSPYNTLVQPFTLNFLRRHWQNNRVVRYKTARLQRAGTCCCTFDVRPCHILQKPITEYILLTFVGCTWLFSALLGNATLPKSFGRLEFITTNRCIRGRIGGPPKARPVDIWVITTPEQPGEMASKKWFEGSKACTYNSDTILQDAKVLLASKSVLLRRQRDIEWSYVQNTTSNDTHVASVVLTNSTMTFIRIPLMIQTLVEVSSIDLQTR